MFYLKLEVVGNSSNGGIFYSYGIVVVVLVIGNSLADLSWGSRSE